MNQGKWDVVKQEMARLHMEILGISEQKWMGMGEFNSDYHYIWVAPIVKKKSLKCNTLV